MKLKVEELLTKTITDEVLIFQTDTVYGIGCLLSSEKGVERIYEIKKRDGNKPLAVLCGSLSQVETLVDDVTTIRELGLQYWPGGLTLVVPKSDKIPDYVTSGLDTVGVRIPNDEIALQILNTYGPMAVTSLNISSEPAVYTYEDALKYADQVDYLVEGGTTHGVSSTVYDVLNKRVLRQGDVTIK